MTTSRLEYKDLELPKTADEAPRRRRRAWLLVPAGLVLAAAGYQLWRGDLWQRVTYARDWVGARAGALGGAGDGPDAAGGANLLAHTVQPIDISITAVESGTLESASSSPVYSEVAGQTAIIRLIAEGTRVEKGDVVVELDSSSFIKQLTDQQIGVERASNARSQAEQANVTAESKAQGDLANAELALEFTKLDIQKYEQGEYPVARRTMQIGIALAEEELERAQVELQFSEDLAGDKYINQGELEAARFGVTQREFKVENAKENLRLLEQFTFPRTKRDLESKVTEAERALNAVKELARINAQQAVTNLKVQERTLELEKSKLTTLERQIEKCTMRAPQAGVVVYPAPQDEDLVELFIKQGTMIRERQHVFSIPDTNVLQVSTSIHEAKINQIKPGMQARITIAVLSDVALAGEVLHVSPLPDPGDWRRTTVKFYETKVKLNEQLEGLRPGMSAKVEILIDHLEAVLALPVQSVVQRGRSGLCYVLAGGAPELRRVRIGKASNEFVEIVEGLSAGERVVLAPDVLGIPTAALQEAEAFQWAPLPSAAAPDVEAPAEAVQETEYEAVLLGPGTAVAEAQFEIQVSSSLTKREFDVKVVGGTPEATWDVAVAGIVIGSVTLDAVGGCESEWNSKKGTFPANFPLDAAAGTPVSIGELQGVLQ